MVCLSAYGACITIVSTTRQGNAMPRKRVDKPSTVSCSHMRLSLNPTAHAVDAGYQRPTFKQRAAATTIQGREPQTLDLDASDPSTFPAPLVLPGDDLSLDPKYPPQSVRAWIREKERNKVTPEKRTIYVAAPPDVDPDVDFIRTWGQPTIRLVDCPRHIAPPNVQDVVHYLSSFYYGLSVKSLPASNLRFSQWEDVSTMSLSEVPKGTGKSKPKFMAHTEEPDYIGLATPAEVIRIRTRQSLSPAFRRQVNLDDLLDAAITVLPDDAYALLLLVEYDLFEDEDDEFTCGRAYGGSRVAVVSSARYHPGLDHAHGVEREHAWPASHCKEYLDSFPSAEGLKSVPIRAQGGRERKKSKGDAVAEEMEGFKNVVQSPLEAAVTAHTAGPSFHGSSELEGLWLGRVCKTASHELGHCFGIDHCVYYACIMQGSASLAEDARQPPYLCPVDEAKVASATGKGEGERRAKMIEFCNKTGSERIRLFRALVAWLSRRTEA